jgi:hypothetical protein
VRSLLSRREVGTAWSWRKRAWTADEGRGKTMRKLLVVSGKMLCLCLLLASCGPASTPSEVAAGPTPTRTPLPPPISPDFPTGTFFHKHPATFCVWQFNEDGTWAYFWKVMSTDVTGREPYLRGTYAVDGNLYSETSNSDTDCPWPATYTWTYDGQTLAFQVVGEDKCADRQQAYENELLWTKLESTD